MRDIFRFPERKFSSPAEAAQFATNAFYDVVKRRERAALSGKRTEMQVVIDIYERDIIPNAPHFHGHLAADLLNFGQWLQDLELIDRAIAINRATPPHGGLGQALLVRGEFDPSGTFLEEAAAYYEAHLQNWRDFDQYACCRFSVDLGRAYVAMAERDGDEVRIRAGLAAFAKADPIHAQDRLSLDLAHQRVSEARAHLFFFLKRMPTDLEAGDRGLVEALSIYQRWKHPYVVPPVWIERAERLRTAIADRSRSS